MALTKEDIQAIGTLMDEKLVASNEVLRQEMAANNDSLRQEMAANNKSLRLEMGHMMDEKLGNALAPIHKKLIILESLPRQINAIAEGHIGISRRLDNLETQVNSLEKKLDNSVIIKAVTPSV